MSRAQCSQGWGVRGWCFLNLSLQQSPEAFMTNVKPTWCLKYSAVQWLWVLQSPTATGPLRGLSRWHPALLQNPSFRCPYSWPRNSVSFVYLKCSRVWFTCTRVPFSADVSTTVQTRGSEESAFLSTSSYPQKEWYPDIQSSFSLSAAL